MEGEILHIKQAIVKNVFFIKWAMEDHVNLQFNIEILYFDK